MEIRKIIDAGQFEKAHAALDHLLFLGPVNTEALKLKSILFAHEGKFTDEAKIWEKVINYDEEDLDAIFYFQRRHLEERESFYFTDNLPGGGRRFLAQPRALLAAAFFCVLGSITFLLLTSLARQYFFLAMPLVAYSCFGVFVVLPWLFIVYYYLTSLKEIVLLPTGIGIVSRMKNRFLRWEEIENCYLAHATNLNNSTLSLLVKPRDASIKPIEIDLTRESTWVRARIFFIDEIARLFRSPVCINRANIPFDLSKVSTF